MNEFYKITDDMKRSMIGRRIRHYKLKHAVTELAEKTGFDKGNISAMLKRKKPISDNFLQKVVEAYPLKDDDIIAQEWHNIEATEASKEKMRLILKEIDADLANNDPGMTDAKYFTELLNSYNEREASLIKKHRDEVEFLEQRILKAREYYHSLIVGMLNYDDKLASSIEKMKDGAVQNIAEEIAKRRAEILTKLLRINEMIMLKSNEEIQVYGDQEPKQTSVGTLAEIRRKYTT